MSIDIITFEKIATNYCRWAKVWIANKSGLLRTSERTDSVMKCVCMTKEVEKVSVSIELLTRFNPVKHWIVVEEFESPIEVPYYQQRNVKRTTLAGNAPAWLEEIELQQAWFKLAGANAMNFLMLLPVSDNKETVKKWKATLELAFKEKSLKQWMNIQKWLLAKGILRETAYTTFSMFGNVAYAVQLALTLSGFRGHFFTPPMKRPEYHENRACQRGTLLADYRGVVVSS